MIQLTWPFKVFALVAGSAGSISSALVQASGDPHPPSAKHDDPLSGLIERSNALRSFVAEYHAMSKGEDAGKIRIVFSAPDRMRIRIDSHDSIMELVCKDARMYVRTPDDHGGVQTGSCDVDVIPTSVLERIGNSVHAAFPKADVNALQGDPSPFVQFIVGTEKESDKPTFTFSAGMARHVDAILQWLPTIQRNGKLVEEKENALVFDLQRGVRISLRKDSGFIERVQSTWNGDERCPLELIHLETDGSIDPAEFRPPENDPGAKDISEAVKDLMLVTLSASTKGTVLAAVHQSFGNSGPVWDAEAKSALRGVLRVFHTEMLSLQLKDWKEKNESHIDEFCRWLQASRLAAGKDDPTEEDRLESKVTERVDALRDHLDRARDSYLSQVAAQGDAWDEDPFWKDAKDLDRDSAEAAFLEEVQEPLLARFEEKLGLAREGKLDPPVEKDKSIRSDRLP